MKPQGLSGKEAIEVERPLTGSPSFWQETKEDRIAWRAVTRDDECARERELFSDVRDQEWALIVPLFPAVREGRSPRTTCLPVADAAVTNGQPKATSSGFSRQGADDVISRPKKLAKARADLRHPSTHVTRSQNQKQSESH